MSVSAAVDSVYRFDKSARTYDTIIRALYRITDEYEKQRGFHTTNINTLNAWFRGKVYEI
jgi:hypothetical protein